MNRAKVGFCLLAPVRFQKIGEGTPGGTYFERKAAEAHWMVDEAQKTMDVVFPGVIYTREDADRAVRRFVTEEVDCVLSLYLSWAEDWHLNRVLRDLPPMPVLYAYRMRDEVNLGDTHEEGEFAEYLCCGGLVGSLEGSGDVKRYNRPMCEITAGTFSEVLARLNVFANAAKARTLLRHSNIGLLACYNEIMWSTYVDPYSVFMQVGPELNFLSVAELCDKIEEIPEEEAVKVRERLKAEYKVLPGVDDGKFLASVRATMGMEKLARDHNVDLVVLNDVDTMLFEKVGLRPGFYPSSPDVKTVIVPEGDIGAGLATFMLKLLTGKTCHFLEPFHVDVPSDTFEGGHAGPNDYTNPKGYTQISNDVRFAKTKYKYAGAPFAWHVFPQGLHTMVHVSQQNGKFVMAVTLVESLPQTPHLATYCHGRFKPVGESCKELFEKLLRIGVTQHYALVEGDVTQDITDLGHMLGMEVTRV